MTKKWITPFKKQCFVTLGVSLNMASHGMVMGFTVVLLPQLKLPGSLIPIDDAAGSWIASILGFALVVGNFIVPTIMTRYGRKIANIASVLLMMIGWVCIVLATSVTTLLIARCMQGAAMGMTASMGPVLIGEYTSPNNRGPLLTTVSLAIATGVVFTHALGAFMSWQYAALVITIVSFIDLVIILYSPESPSWLADHGRYEDCKKTFRWLRGDSEEEELERMIESSVILIEAKKEIDTSESFLTKLKRNIAYFNVTIRRKEFYKPIFLMIHIYTLGQWAGASVLASYTSDVFTNVVGHDANVSLLVITLGVQRIISNTGAIYVIKKVKRRTMLFLTVGINLFAYLATAAYTYYKSKGCLPFDHPMIGILLVHIHMFSIAVGTVPLPFIISGEVFPLEFRSIAGAISVLFMASNLFIVVKTFPLFITSIGLHGVYIVYAVVVGYCLLIAYFFLPETKDRTLQEIEDEFRGRPMSPEEMKSVQSLNSMKLYRNDRRCSSPFV